MRRLACLTLGAALVGCRSPTQIEVLVTTDVACAKWHGAAMAVGLLGDPLERAPASTSTLECQPDGHIGSVVVVPSGANDESVAIKVVAALDQNQNVETCTDDARYAGCIVARRALRFIPHESLRLAVPMLAACKDQPCEATETCVQGACRPATIVDPGACASQTCGEGSLAPPAGSSDGGAADAGAHDASNDATLSDASPADASDDTSAPPITLDAETGGCGAGCGVSLGQYYTCATREGGVRCWGQNVLGELGDGVGGPTPSTVLQQNGSPLDAVRGIVTTTDTTCALRTSGDVSCWGAAVALGPGFSGDLFMAAGAPNMNNASQIALGTYHACWVGAASVLCTDDGDKGQAPHGVIDAGRGPTPLAFQLPLTQLVASESFTCALRADKTLWCVGNNDSNNVQPGGANGVITTPARVYLPGDAGAEEIALMQVTGCARVASGQVQCWGNSQYGAAGYDPGLPYRLMNEVQLVDGGPLGATQLAAGEEFGCARLANAQVACWGRNNNAQLGRGHALDAGLDWRASLVVGPDGGGALSNVTFVAAQGFHACAVVADGSLWCWGSNASGELGNGTTTDTAVPVRANF